MNKKIIATILVITIVFGGGTSYFFMQQKKADAPLDKLTTAQEFTLSRTTVKEMLETTGTIRSTNIRQINSKLTGEITDTFFEIGEQVNLDESLISLDVFDIALSIASKEASMLAIRQQIVQLEIQKNNSEKSNFENSKVAYDSAMILYSQNISLYDSGAVSKSTLDASESNKIREHSNYVAAKSNYESYDYLDEIDTLNGTLALEQLRLDDLNNNLSNHTILSPITGDITNKFVSEGDLINQGSALYELQDLDSLEITANISEYEIYKVKLGQHVAITSYGDDSTQYHGIVKEIYPVAEISGSDVTITIVIDITDEDRMLKPNFTANLTIITNMKNDAFMVPYEAITSTPKGVFLNTGLENSKPIMVETGIESDMMIEIISDQLEEGMVINIQTALNLSTKGFEQKGLLPMGAVPGTRKKPTGTTKKSN